MLAHRFVSPSFSKFLESLYRQVVADPYHPMTIALDAPRVRGQRLATILQSLGCKKWKYPGNPRETVRRPAWHWPKYQSTGDVGGPAFLSLEKNRTYGFFPKFDERPEGHKMLVVNVTKSQRSACIRELTDALGKGAVLLGGD